MAEAGSGSVSMWLCMKAVRARFPKVRQLSTEKLQKLIEDKSASSSVVLLVGNFAPIQHNIDFFTGWKKLLASSESVRTVFVKTHQILPGTLSKGVHVSVVAVTV